MAVPLRRVAGGYPDTAARPQRQPRPDRSIDLAPKRLVRRQIRSNAEVRRTTAWVFMGMTAILFLMGISSIFVKAGVSQMNFNINSISAENEMLALENDKIRGQIAELRSLDRIEEIAIRELGLVKNERIEYMVLSSTIVAEGKIRATNEEPEVEEPDAGPLDSIEKAIDFLLSLIESRSR